MSARTVVKVGPADHGRRMSLADFDHAEAREGFLYELGRGVIVVSDVPHPRHFAQADVARMQFDAYRQSHPGRIVRVGNGAECKILIPDYDSERHPDLAVYMTPPPDGPDVWSLWVPEIVVEIVSKSSRRRDYFEKPEEYLRFGVLEYWIIDAEKGWMHVKRREAGAWTDQVVQPPDAYRTGLLPEFEFAVGPVFEAGR